MNECKLSIIVPVYGVEKYIDKCLNSLVKQSLKEIEIIVVNDGTKDNSQKIVDKYVKKYPDKIKSYIKENGGQGSARNYGLKKATGEYIGYVDSDDFVEKDMYKKLYNKAKENNYDIVVCGNYNVSEDYQNKNIDAFINNYNTDLENIFFGKMAVWNKIYKRDILIKNKLEFKEKVWYEDLAFTLKAIMNSNTFAFIDEPLYDYLIREGSTMNNSNVQRNLEILDAFNDILSYIQHNKKEEYFSKIEFLAIDHIYISAIVRVLKAEADDKVKRETINKLIDYMNKKFPNYKNNKYINTLSKNRKIIYKLINIKMYGLINLIFKVKKG
jgi:glycosyltransferase involved in cell wall biosynthesis